MKSIFAFSPRTLSSRVTQWRSNLQERAESYRRLTEEIIAQAPSEESLMVALQTDGIFTIGQWGEKEMTEDWPRFELFLGPEKPNPCLKPEWVVKTRYQQLLAGSPLCVERRDHSLVITVDWSTEKHVKERSAQKRSPRKVSETEAPGKKTEVKKQPPIVAPNEDHSTVSIQVAKKIEKSKDPSSQRVEQKKKTGEVSPEVVHETPKGEDSKKDEEVEEEETEEIEEEEEEEEEVEEEIEEADELVFDEEE